MGFLVREFKSVAGELVAVLIDDQGSPSFWPNVYAVSEYINANKSPRTASKMLRTLAMACNWAESHGFDLDEALSVGNLITVSQAESLAHFLRLDAKNQRRTLSGASNSTSNCKVISLENNQGYRKSKESEVVAVSAIEAATRIRWIIKYIEWHMQERVGSMERARKDVDLFKVVGDAIISKLKGLTPRAKSTSVDDERLEGISVDTCKLAEESFRPGSNSNPFTSGFIQERNYLIWRFLYETGMRREELQSLLVAKVDYSLRRVSITKSKTQLRTIPISELLAVKFHKFILSYWGKIPARQRKHGFLFTTESGRHLGLNSINLIFRTARTCNKSLPEFFAPHVMRRTHSDRIEELKDVAQEQYGPNIDLKAIHNRLNGWTDNSDMSDKYAKRARRIRADKIAEKLVNELTPSNGK